MKIETLLKEKINLANIPSPVEKLEFNGSKFFIKRDDFTGSELSGNKVRKLEYIFKDLISKGYNRIITYGGEQSNHCRATAVAGLKLGLKTKLYLWGNESKEVTGNQLFYKLSGAETVYLDEKTYINIEEYLSNENNEGYLIPEGGSSVFGVLGYINFVLEMKDFIESNSIKGIWLAGGSGGTAAGLILGISFFNLNIQINVVNVLYDKATLLKKINKVTDDFMRHFDYSFKVDFNKLNIVEGFSDEGYKHITDEKIEIINKLFKETGILLDPAYTGKAFYAFNQKILGNYIEDNLFLHTGGLFGVFPKINEYLKSIKAN